MKALLILAFLATTLVSGTSVQAQQPELRRTLELDETQFMRLTSASSLTQARQVMLEAKLIALSSARSAASSLGQRSFAHSVGQSSTRRIPLVRNAAKNGYTTTQEGNTIYFQAVNVVDPSGKKLLAGLKQLEYQCPGNPASITVNLQFSNGHSDRISVSCLALIKPRILVMEERSEPN